MTKVDLTFIKIDLDLNKVDLTFIKIDLDLNKVDLTFIKIDLDLDQGRLEKLAILLRICVTNWKYLGRIAATDPW